MMRACVSALLAVTVAACGDSPAPTDVRPEDLVPTSILRAGGDQQQGPAAMPLPQPMTARVVDASGQGVPGVAVLFTPYGGWISPAGEVLTDENGLASTTWYMGSRAADNVLVASSSVGATGFRGYAIPLSPGATYLGADGLTELRMGDLPLVLSAPHGGTEEPSSIPDRIAGDVTPDPHTDALVRAIDASFAARGDGRPTLVISHLARSKADMDHALQGATAGSVEAERAWREYQGFLAAARAFLQDQEIRGLLVDVHGHDGSGHVELGYLLTADDLSAADAELNGSPFLYKSSIRDIGQNAYPPFSTVVRGQSSLGALLDGQGVAAVPSPATPQPAGEGYLPGGYTVERYGSQDGSLVSALFLQVPTEIRNIEAGRAQFAGKLVDALDAFFAQAYGRTLVSR